MARVGRVAVNPPSQAPYVRVTVAPTGAACEEIGPFVLTGRKTAAVRFAVRYRLRLSRFEGYVSGRIARGVSDRFIAPDGLDLTFIDHERPGTPYRVCWTGPLRQCWNRTTGARGVRSAIFTPAPPRLGQYRVRWYIGRRVVAHWSVRIVPGDPGGPPGGIRADA